MSQSGKYTALEPSAREMRARYATVHWVRYPSIRVPDELPLDGRPAGVLSWKIGPDGPLGSEGARLPSDVWCGVALFRDRNVSMSLEHLVS
ncbi:MAG: hypothetical protein KGO02_17550 [Alphaproteobacteria bacterium]|nr:hypothetical protein [Alphaproteobacteria bacterium]